VLGHFIVRWVGGETHAYEAHVLPSPIDVFEKPNVLVVVDCCHAANVARGRITTLSDACWRKAPPCKCAHARAQLVPDAVQATVVVRVSSARCGAFPHDAVAHLSLLDFFHVAKRREGKREER
jgi:hypothetical protein